MYVFCVCRAISLIDGRSLYKAKLSAALTEESVIFSELASAQESNQQVTPAASPDPIKPSTKKSVTTEKQLLVSRIMKLLEEIPFETISIRFVWLLMENHEVETYLGLLF